jgi:hypothetical protein
MANERKALLVPHGKQGVTLENLAHNLDALSVFVSIFVALTVKKHPELKSEMIEALQEIYTQDGLSSENRQAIANALAMTEDLIAETNSLD